jgi:hypothetical protein
MRLRKVSGPVACSLVLLISFLIVGHTAWTAYQVSLASALCDAAYQGDVKETRRWLRTGADPNRLNALGYAKRGGNKEVIAMLEQAGAKEKTGTRK